MRRQDPIPDWTTHLALIRKDGAVYTGKKDEVLERASAETVYPISQHEVHSTQGMSSANVREGAALVQFAGVNVTYGDRKVCVQTFH